jgi:hypothetical protein
MRAMLPAAAVLGLVALLTSRSVLAAPPPSKTRPMKKVLVELAKDPALKPMLASARYAAEVFKAEAAEQAPTGQLDVISPVIRALTQRQCAALTKQELQASNGLLAAYGSTLPPLVHAFALGQSGKKTEAGDEFLRLADVAAVPRSGICPDERRSTSSLRLEHLQLIWKCVRAVDPKRDTTRLGQQLDKAEACAMTNTSGG